MANKVKDITGESFGRLTAVERMPTPEGKRGTYWKCRCECGNTYVGPSHEITRTDRNGTKSCGCLKKDVQLLRSRTHGMSYTTEYTIWRSMKQRCSYKNHMYYKMYGGRGVGYDPSWENFESFYADMGGRPKGTSLDRIDNSRGYSKDNCCWSTQKEQCNNRRDNRHITYNGETLTVAEWADKTGMKPGTVLARINKGWSAEEVLTKPLRNWTKRNNL